MDGNIFSFFDCVVETTLLSPNVLLELVKILLSMQNSLSPKCKKYERADKLISDVENSLGASTRSLSFSVDSD